MIQTSITHRQLSGISSQTQRTQRIYKLTEFTNLRKLQPIGTELCSFRLISSFQGIKKFKKNQ